MASKTPAMKSEARNLKVLYPLFKISDAGLIFSALAKKNYLYILKEFLEMKKNADPWKRFLILFPFLFFLLFSFMLLYPFISFKFNFTFYHIFPPFVH